MSNVITGKNKVIKHSVFGWKSKSSLLNWRAAKSALIHSPVGKAGRLRRSPGVTLRDRKLDCKIRA